MLYSPEDLVNANIERCGDYLVRVNGSFITFSDLQYLARVLDVDLVETYELENEVLPIHKDFCPA
ncbi:MAG: hypothetical protein CFH44_00261 [Proteobacteria bacterium]|nr:MAG: hypothetical protein CFH44_00261 [Pseudomonadota bacterium]